MENSSHCKYTDLVTMEETLSARNGGNLSWSGSRKCSMGNKLTSVEFILASIIISLCLAAVSAVEYNCDVTVKVDSTGVNPSSFTLLNEGPTSSVHYICVQDQDGRVISVSLSTEGAMFLTDDYNVSLFTRSSECEVLDQRVDKKTGKTITNYECKYKNSEQHQNCAFLTKPNGRGKPFFAHSNSGDGRVHYLGIEGPHEKEIVSFDRFGHYELNFSKFLPDSSVTLFMEIDWKYPTVPDQWLLYDADMQKSYYINDKRRGDPKNGDFGDYQLHWPKPRHRWPIKYSDPIIKCGYLDKYSCKCTVQEQSLVSYIESHKSELEKPGKVSPFGSDMTSELLFVTEHESSGVDVRLRLAT